MSIKKFTTVILFIFFLLTSCGQTTQNNAKPKDSIITERMNPKKSDSVKQVSPKIIFGPDTITPLPFGSEVLLNYKFSKSWETPEADPSNENIPPVKDELKYSELFKDFISLNAHQPIAMPAVKKITQIDIDSTNSCYSLKKHSNEVKYHLPDFGPYQVYYQYHRIIQDDYINNCTEYADLILYDPQNKEAKVLNIYKQYIEEFYEQDWLFYIDKAKVINIYISDLYTNKQTMRKAFEIHINDRGEIKIDKIHD